MKAPERIWATTGAYFDYVQDWSEGEWDATKEDAVAVGADERVVEYIHIDRHNAEIGASYRQAAQICTDLANDDLDYDALTPKEAETLLHCADIIRDRTPADAKAALEKMLGEAREEGRREVVDAIGGLLPEEHREAAMRRLNSLKKGQTDG